jgi:hypothetical protein
VTKAPRSPRTRCPLCAFDPSMEIAGSELLFASRTAHPVTPRHTLVLPRRNAATFLDLNDLVLLRQLRDEIVAQDGAFEGNIGVNVGPVAGQTILHCHATSARRCSRSVGRCAGDHTWKSTLSDSQCSLNGLR